MNVSHVFDGTVHRGRRRSRRLVLVAGVTAILATGCGDDTGTDSPSEPAGGVDDTVRFPDGSLIGQTSDGEP